ncbi:TetR/AcrR family transcriptional regulator [Noviherbaspirillum sp. UKPF54]|uniref:TetR/AcrR family transcriptional regulator n=1 Tax=Noviherbaspirillum sp. UKPF54 TaxID=2601898 RepID=UPI0011B19A9A|nr:TetR/AcrR family transcriptional regulator [Noviherbaspirillum sp. UKPF54]QDZ29603.1 TetR/AcrR family transcriptional regulator [Noviherbaspirillum sp. UKPF54]
MTSEALNTRGRILATCLRLFNESNPAAVTTAEIARTVGINEGNLYYYFKKKEDILVALFEQFEAALDDVANAPPAAHDVGPGYLEKWFNLMWEWRFFYRDTAAIKRMAPALHGKGMALAERGQADVRRALQQMADAGLLKATSGEIERLVVNAWIVSSYWLDYLHSRHNVEQVTREHIGWGFAQVMSLFEPYAVRAVGAASQRKSA